MIVLVLPLISSLPDCAGLYRITCSVTRRFYVGSAANLRKRMGQHLYRLGRGDHPNPAMQALWAAHGRFVVEVLQELPGASMEVRLAAEQKILDAAFMAGRQCLNVESKAGSPQGVKRRSETVERLRQSATGRTHSQASKARMRAAKIGKRLSPEHRQRLSDVRRGRPVSRPLGIINKAARGLGEEDVRALRCDRDAGMSWSLLSSRYGISKGAAKRAANRVTYREVV